MQMISGLTMVNAPTVGVKGRELHRIPVPGSKVSAFAALCGIMAARS
jgi:hypothetical protein